MPFIRADRPLYRRLVLAIDGLEKQGKTHFALTAPPPIYMLSFDAGSEGVVQKFQHQKAIHEAEYKVPRPKKGMTESQVIEQMDRVWEQFIEDYETALTEAATVVVDTASEMWELLRLARLGKLLQVKPHHYTQCNQEYRDMIRLAIDGTANLILLHKMKAEWLESNGKANKTGRYERLGFGETGFLAQMNAHSWRDLDGAFHLTLKDSRHNPDLAGADLSGPMLNFDTLLDLVFGENDSSSVTQPNGSSSITPHDVSG